MKKKKFDEDTSGVDNHRLVTVMVVVVCMMFLFGFALVPIYNVLCKKLGINGKTGTQVTYPLNQYIVDKSRVVTVEFVATTNDSLANWEFRPLTNKIKLHPGEEKQLKFWVRNPESEKVSVQAIPSVTPGIAAQYLKKTECFCFVQQKLKAKQSLEMPLVFHIDPALPKEIQTVTLSYTLFRVNH